MQNFQRKAKQQHQRRVEAVLRGAGADGGEQEAPGDGERDELRRVLLTGMATEFNSRSTEGPSWKF